MLSVMLREGNGPIMAKFFHTFKRVKKLKYIMFRMDEIIEELLDYIEKEYKVKVI
jgi:hypothetical protein